MYSCGIFETEIVPKANPVKSIADSFDQSILSNYQKSSSLFKQNLTIQYRGSLECAQARKISALLSRLEPLSPQHTLLDIGFGWGGICIYAAEKYGCQVHGITLSKEQTALALERVKAKGLEHLMTFELIDYREFARVRAQRKNRKFDRIVSCEMIEAVGHNHLKSFFAAVDSLLDVEGIFVMQAITMPDARYPLYVKSADFLNTIIFPGGCCPSLGALLEAMSVSSTLHLENAVNMNLHYAETLRQWRYRFNRELPRVMELGFDDAFIRLWNLYFCQCEAGFDAQIINLQILTFSRTGNPNMIPKRSTEFISAGMDLLK
jgi:cyclopropane-fatty-acyl-phospholipid synthase